jgi:hypothetical protein
MSPPMLAVSLWNVWFSTVSSTAKPNLALRDALPTFQAAPVDSYFPDSVSHREEHSRPSLR